MKLISESYDKATGITEQYWHHTDGSDKLTIRRLQDVEDTLDANRQAFNHYDGVKYNDSKGLHHVARIPMMVIEKWLREDGFNWFNSTDKERRRKLNSPENRYLLVRPGKL